MKLSSDTREALGGIKSKEPTSQRLRTVLTLNRLINAGPGILSVEGFDNLQNALGERAIIMAISHRTAQDISLTAGVVSLVTTNIGIAVMSDLYRRPVEGSQLRLAGLGSFYPIGWDLINGKEVPRKFDPDEYKPMLSALDNGRSILISAHNPSNGVLPKKPGGAAAYLARKSGLSVLPISVEISGQKAHPEQFVTDHIWPLFRYNNAIVIFGEPMPATDTDGYKISGSKILNAIRNISRSP